MSPAEAGDWVVGRGGEHGAYQEELSYLAWKTKQRKGV